MAALVAGAVVLAGGLAFAQTSPQPSTGAAAPSATAAPAPSATNDTAHRAAIGMPVISADGQTVGQVLSVGPGADSKTMAYVVKPAEDMGSKAELKIPVDKTEMNGKAVQLTVKLADAKKLYVH